MGMNKNIDFQLARRSNGTFWTKWGDGVRKPGCSHRALVAAGRESVGQSNSISLLFVEEVRFIKKKKIKKKC